MTNEIDWSQLRHVRGDASDIPKLIRQLRKPKKWQEAAYELDDRLMHQGWLTEAAIPAVGELVPVVADPAVPGRAGALQLIVDYGYCMRDVSDEWEESAAAWSALADAAERMLPLLDDPDPAVRLGVAQIVGCCRDLPAPVLAVVHARLAEETAIPVAGALVTAVQAHDGLTETERTRLKNGPDELRFALAASALAQGTADSESIDTAATLWNQCAYDHLDVGIDDLVETNGLASLELFDRLAAQSGRALAVAVYGYQLIAQQFRLGLEPALRGLLAVADRLDTLPKAKPWLYKTVVQALADLAPRVVSSPPDDEASDRFPLAGVPGRPLREVVDDDLRTRWAEALVHLAATSPRHTWGPKSMRHDIRADTVVALRCLGDDRWISTLDTVLADAGGKANVYFDNTNPDGGSMGPVVGAVGDFLKTHPASDDETEALVRILAREVTVKGSVLSQPLAWFRLIETLPTEATAFLAPAVAEMLTYVAAKPKRMRRDGPSLLSCCAPVLTRWKDPAVVPALTALARADWSGAPFAEVVIGVITGQCEVDESVRRHGLPGRPGHHAEFLDLWSQTPTPGLIDQALQVVGDTVGGYGDQDDQLVAARIAAQAGRLDDVWPVVLEIAEQGDLQKEAIDLAVELAGDNQSARDGLIEVLHRIAESGTTYAVVAWDGLDRLGARLDARAVRAAVATLSDNGWYTCLACDLLVRIAADPEQSASVTAALTTAWDTIQDSERWIHDYVGGSRRMVAVRRALDLTADPA
ncbi:MAG: hypothetical protein FWH11_08800 [Micrococcales bacterium]|nr:hypothetical protein [Micrococcales bacterium]